MRQRLFEIVNRAHKGDRVSRAYNIFMIVVAFASIAPGIVHTENYPPFVGEALHCLDIAAVYMLTFDYVMRWMTHDYLEGRPGSWKSLVKYPFRPSAIVDLLGIMPTLGILPDEFLFFRAFRIFHIFRYSHQLTIIANVFSKEKKTLWSIFVLAVAYIFITALIMFSVEYYTFDNFIEALYWATITLTTVGFGDIHPTTSIGYFLTSISSLFGVFILALPAGIMTGSFLTQLRMRQDEDEDIKKKKLQRKERRKGRREHFKMRISDIKPFLRTHPKVRMYSYSMGVGLLLNLVLCGLFELIGQPVWLDTTGTALVASTLEPAAGILVSFVHNMILAFWTGNVGNLLYFVESAVVALTYGLMLRRDDDGHRSLKNSFKVLFVVIAVQTFVSVGLSMILAHGQMTTVFCQHYQSYFLNHGHSLLTATILSALIERTADAFLVFILVDMICVVSVKFGVLPRKWIKLEEAKIDVEEQQQKHLQKKEVAQQDEPETQEDKPPKQSQDETLALRQDVVCLSRDALHKIEKHLRKQARESEDLRSADIYTGGATALMLLQNEDANDIYDFESSFKYQILLEQEKEAKTD